MKAIIRLHYLPKRRSREGQGPGCPLRVFSPEFKQEGSIHYGSGGCNVQMDQVLRRPPPPSQQSTAFMARPRPDPRRPPRGLRTRRSRRSAQAKTRATRFAQTSRHAKNSSMAAGDPASREHGGPPLCSIAVHLSHPEWFLLRDAKVNVNQAASEGHQ